MMDESGELHRWDRRTREPEDLGRAPLAPPGPPFQNWRGHYVPGVFLGGGKRIAAIGSFTGLQVADLAQGKELYGHDPADRLAVSRDERTLAIATKGTDRRVNRCFLNEFTRTSRTELVAIDGTIVVLDTETGKEKVRIAVTGSEVWALTFSPDGKSLAATSGWEAGRIGLYDVATGKPIQLLETPPLHPRQQPWRLPPVLTFTPDGKRLITGMSDDSILVWDVQSGP